MACINPDGTLTPSAKKVLFALRTPGTQSDVAELTSMPMYRVRVSLRELIEAGFLEEINGDYQATEKGIAQI